MIMQLKNVLGVYQPLDLFEDFEIKYNHQYEDYKTIEGRAIPYTGKFKLPTTQNNRYLTGVLFDATYPTTHSVDGRMLYNDQTVAFYFIADIEGQKINTLQPYIEVSIIDVISKAISDLSKYKMSDLFLGETINFTTDSWFFGLQSDLTASQSFVFPFINFNNKQSIFAYDSKRKLTQLQPTFILNKLIDKIFNYVGVSINSAFLNNDNELATGVKANELAMMIPLDFRTIDNRVVVLQQKFASVAGVTINGYVDRIVGVPSVTPTTPRLAVSNFLNNDVNGDALKINYDFRSDEYWDGAPVADILGKRWCSTVDGKMKVLLKSNNPTVKPYFLLGKMFQASASGDYTKITSVTGTPISLDIQMVDANMERRLEGSGSDHEISFEYDIAKSFNVGTANLVTGLFDANGNISVDGKGYLKYEIDFASSAAGYFDVQANQDIELGFVFVPNTVYNQRVTMTSELTLGTHVVDIKITNGYTQYDVVSSTTFEFDKKMDTQTTLFYIPTGTSLYPTNLTIDFEEYTSLPSGFIGQDAAPADGTRDDVEIVNCDISLSESFKAVEDYSLIKIVKMIMQRYNLQFYSDSSGLIWIDSEKNRLSGVDLIIDHLIDESIDVDFAYNENGILTITDSNPSFYEDNFNRLDKYEVSATKRDLVTFNFDSSVYSGKMFEDVYDGTGYDVLKYKNDSNYWGTCDRTQQKPKSLKPMFCFLIENSALIYFPFNLCSYSYYDTSLDLLDPAPPQIDFGFYNVFKNVSTVPRTLTTASASHPSGFKLISFYDDENITGTDNLYKQTWYSSIMDNMNDESINMIPEIYVSEDTFKILKDFPNIKYKGQDWTFKGLNEFPLNAQNGGMTKVTLIKKNIWS